jgi:hypothetical protein
MLTLTICPTPMLPLGVETHPLENHKEIHYTTHQRHDEDFLLGMLTQRLLVFQLELDVQ